MVVEVYKIDTKELVGIVYLDSKGFRFETDDETLKRRLNLARKEGIESLEYAGKFADNVVNIKITEETVGLLELYLKDYYFKIIEI